MTSVENPRTKPLLDFFQTQLNNINADIPELQYGGINLNNEVPIDDIYQKVCDDIFLRPGTYIIQGTVTIDNKSKADAQIMLSIFSGIPGSFAVIETAYKSILDTAKETVHVYSLLTVDTETILSLQPKLEADVGAGVVIIGRSHVSFHALSVRSI